MAAVEATADMTIKKNSEILVYVEEALADLIVVSYSTNDKKFQGVLLDSTKGNLPFGVYNLHPVFSKKPVEASNEDDKLHSVSRRFAYEDPDYQVKNVQPQKKSGAKTKPQSRQKMTVRLRPRKVLCSNCKGICNENNENVDVSKKRKFEDDDDHISERPDSSQVHSRRMNSTLIPKLSRLDPSEITDAIKGSKISSKPNEKSSNKLKSDKNVDGKISPEFKTSPELAFVSVPEHSDKEFNESESSFNPMFSNARTLKICFGEGEGTVVKIPPFAGDYNEDSGVSCDMSKVVKTDSKAAKKALKKAKKQAKKNTKPENEIETTTKHIGALSPRNNVSDPLMQDPLEKKHRHRVKHKKKSKVRQKRDENSSKSMDDETINYFSDIKDCLKQKLSISLRRLSSNSYEKQSEDNGDCSDSWESDSVPEFPENSPSGISGRLIRVSPGDVVWGKVVGFPWWPGRVVSVSPGSGANVAWYASTTSSLMPYDNLSPFLEDFKLRFNKKKRGPYKEAVKQATLEAKQKLSIVDDALDSTGNLTKMSPRPINVFS